MLRSAPTRSCSKLYNHPLQIREDATGALLVYDRGRVSRWGIALCAGESLALLVGESAALPPGESLVLRAWDSGLGLGVFRVLGGLGVLRGGGLAGWDTCCDYVCDYVGQWLGHGL